MLAGVLLHRLAIPRGYSPVSKVQGLALSRLLLLPARLDSAPDGVLLPTTSPYHYLEVWPVLAQELSVEVLFPLDLETLGRRLSVASGPLAIVEAVKVVDAPKAVDVVMIEVAVAAAAAVDEDGDGMVEVADADEED